ncbi:MAG: DUF87 domain-containing protein [Anaerolineales bacterium]|nr:DUF87 domain-containing protein [Anaerolineales bacterium]
MSKSKHFYLGRLRDLKTGKTGKTDLLYDPSDLVTHGVVFGMTGSGKTGLCIGLLEEAALQGIPALIIDPKGDITNALLHFPELRPDDFEPWINPDEARRANKSPAELATETAALWKKGLADWGIGPERIRALDESTDFAVYTPGSNAGLPVSILASLAAPELDWDGNQEVIRERIASTATAILGLVGLKDIDPVKSREHILLANLFENAWSAGKDLKLEDLIRQVQNPPLAKIGILDLDKFFPAKDRAALALKLNNILAAPSFKTWLEGQPLDIAQLLYTPEGRPRHAIFTLSHLPEAERMFFVTLLYSALETWIYSLKGSSSLRAIVYFDEIHGFLPPVAQPPSKAPLLRLLKQARAFGVGQLLATQNPVDVDYKALSNAGTWFIGKLQTERDIDRLLDGLEGAEHNSFKRSDYARIISGLDKRVFLLHNVHEKQPVVFETRWVMNYLAGPLTRSQIPQLNLLKGKKAEAAKPSTAPEKEKAKMDDVSVSKPIVPSGVQEVFMPASLSLEASAQANRRELPAGAKRLGYIYRPALIGQAQVRFNQRKYNLDTEIHKAAMVDYLDGRTLRWDDFERDPVEERSLEARPVEDSSFGALSGPLADEKQLKGLEREFTDWVYRAGEAQVWANDALKVYGGPELSREEFLRMTQEAADKKRDDEIEKARAAIEKKVDALQTKLERQRRGLSQKEQRASNRRLEEYGTHAENILSLFLGRRRSLTTSLTKRRLTSEAAATVEASKEEIKQMESEAAKLNEEAKSLVHDIDARWDEVALQISQIPVQATRKDVYVSLFGVVWLPYHRVDVGGREVEFPAF